MRLFDEIVRRAIVRGPTDPPLSPDELLTLAGEAWEAAETEADYVFASGLYGAAEGKPGPAVVWLEPLNDPAWNR